MKAWLKGGLIGLVFIWFLWYWFVIRFTVLRSIPDIFTIITLSLIFFMFGALIGWIIGKIKQKKKIEE